MADQAEQDESKKASTSTRFDRWMRIANVALIAGASAWLVKLVVIVLTDGAERGTADAVAAAFYLPGIVLMLGGSSAVGLWLTRGRGAGVRLAAALVAPVLFFVSMDLLDSIGESLVGDFGPSYFREEAGILLAAVLWLALGILVAAGSRPRRLSAKS